MGNIYHSRRLITEVFRRIGIGRCPLDPVVTKNRYAEYAKP
jgi:hypothetical protein